EGSGAVRRAVRDGAPARGIAVPRHRDHRLRRRLRARVHEGWRGAAHLHAARSRGAQERRQAALRLQGARRSVARRFDRVVGGGPQLGARRRRLPHGGARSLSLAQLSVRRLRRARSRSGDPAGARAGEVEHFAVIPGLGPVEKEELYAAYGIRVLSAENVAELARQLKEAVGDEVAPALPDDDDFEGWLGLLAEEPARADAPSRAAIDDKLDTLSKKLREASDWEKLVDLLLGRVGVEPTVERRAEMLLEVAKIFEHEVGDLSKAFTALVAAYKEHPRPEAWAELERLAQATGTWSELLSELAEVMPTLPDGERAQAWLRLSKLYGEKLGSAEYALTALDEALKLDPELAEAGELRIGLYKRLERWSELQQAYGDSGRFVEQAEVLEARIGDSAGAAAAYRAALDKEPTA